MATLTFDVSGENGANGLPGQTRDHSYKPAGCNGVSGGHGHPGTFGISAGVTTMQISHQEPAVFNNFVRAEPVTSLIGAEYRLAFPNGDLLENTDVLKIPPGQLICLRAQGGDGGCGGDGASGLTGAAGFYGTYPCNGGPGGNGGDGGDAGVGGHGGRGGKINLITTIDDTHLLTLCDIPNVRGGRGGKSGVPGSGGPGGQGGAAGSSSDGDTTVYSAAGPNGQPGRSGHAAASGDDGEDGSWCITVLDGSNKLTYDGFYDLHLLDAQLVPEKDDGIIEPGSRVLVTSITVHNTGKMPTPKTRNVLVHIPPSHNSGSPSLTANNWVVSEGLNRFVQLPRSIPAGATVVVRCASLGDGKNPLANPNSDEHLAFRIAPLTQDFSGDPFRVETQVTVRAQMTPHGHDFANFPSPVRFDVCYPVQMGTLTGLASVAPGDWTLVKFFITNISLKDYGRDGEIGREVAVRVASIGGNTDRSKVTFVPIIGGVPQDPISFKDSTPQLMQSVSPIPKDGRAMLTGRLIFSPDAEQYTAANLSFELLLGEIDNGLRTVPIQKREATVHVSKAYTKTPGSATLLVTNVQMTSAELKAWEDLARSVFGGVADESAGRVDVWDLSQNGHFDLDRVLSSGKTLCDDWQDCTVVILNNMFRKCSASELNEPSYTSAHLSECALDYLDQDQFARAMVSHSINFLIISPLSHATAHQKPFFKDINSFAALQNMLNPFSLTPRSYIVYGCTEDFIAAEIDVDVNGIPIQKRRSQKPSPLHHVNLDDLTAHPYTHVEYIILINRSRPFHTLRKATNLAVELRKMLQRQHPLRRYVLSTCHAWGLAIPRATLPPETQAAIRVRRLLDVSSLTARITLASAPFPADAATTQAHSVITPSKIKAAFVQSIPFPRRVALYADALETLGGTDLTHRRHHEGKADALKASLLADLAREQVSLRMKKQIHGLTRQSIALLLPRLTALCDIKLGGLTVESVHGAHLFDLLAQLLAFVDTRVAWYEPLLPGRRSSAVTSTSISLINELLIARVYTAGPASMNALKPAVKSKLQGWEAELRLLKTAQRGVSLKGHAFASVLGSDANWCQWSDATILDCPTPTIRGNVCTEFAMLFTPEPFFARGEQGYDDGSGIVENDETLKIAKWGLERKGAISNRVSNSQHVKLTLGSPSRLQNA